MKQVPEMLETIEPVPAMNHLEELDPTHVCKVLDEEMAEWGKAHGWIHSYSDEADPEGMQWPVYEEAKGG